MNYAVSAISIFKILYFVSGESNMVPQNYISNQNDMGFTNELLHMFGLVPPKVIKHKLINNTAGTRFLLDIYKFDTSNQIRNGNKVKRSPPEILDLSESYQRRKIEKSNIIVTMENIVKTANNAGKRRKLGFVLPRLNEIKQLVGAELRLFQSKIMEDQIFTISIYEDAKGEDTKLKKVAEKLTSSDYSGWLSLDISFSFATWLKTPRKPQNLYITVSPYNDPDMEMLPSNIGLQTLDSNENDPFVVAYMKSSNKIRLPRSSFLSRTFPTVEELSYDHAPCARRVLKVPFKELYQDWVIVPEVYEASMCIGRCQFPLKTPMVATNHAIMQSLVHLKNPGKFPEPSCVPTEYQPLSMVVREDHNHILMKRDNMIAVSCGCH